MIRHFFLDKTNSIVESSLQNFGLNPTLYIGYGKNLMRGLIHFDCCQIKELIDDGTFSKTDKLRFNLKMTNYFSIDGVPYEKLFIKGIDGYIRRACSYDLMLFKLPCDFDQGRGFDVESDFWVQNTKSYSEEGSNWYYSKTLVPWPYENDKLEMDDFGEHKDMWNFDRVQFDIMAKEVIEISRQYFEENYHDEKCDEVLTQLSKIDYYDRYNDKSLWGGIYSNEELISEYEKYLNGEDSIIVGTQHFDFGNENLCIDITKYVFDAINSGENYGLCLAFVPELEDKKTEFEQFASFVTDNTNTFFHPYVEAVYDEYISDDRGNFVIGKTNNLYLYVNDDGPQNLDELPTCSIDGIEMPVEQVTKGVYKAEIVPNMIDMEQGVIYYDNWSNIVLNGQNLDDVELEFSTPITKKTFGSSNNDIRRNLVPSIYGINYNENLSLGEHREVCIDFLVQYESNKREFANDAEYRLYAKDGNRQIDVIPYTKVEKSFLYNFFMIYTEDLIPNDYFVDIKYKVGREEKYAKEALKFRVVSNVTERYQ